MRLQCQLSFLTIREADDSIFREFFKSSEVPFILHVEFYTINRQTKLTNE